MSQAANQYAPVYDVLYPPNDDGTVLMVMPFLSEWEEPAFKTIGEIIDLVKQVFEVSSCVLPIYHAEFRNKGLQFMHSCSVAHK